MDMMDVLRQYTAGGGFMRLKYLFLTLMMLCMIGIITYLDNSTTNRMYIYGYMCDCTSLSIRYTRACAHTCHMDQTYSSRSPVSETQYQYKNLFLPDTPNNVSTSNSSNTTTASNIILATKSEKVVNGTKICNGYLQGRPLIAVEKDWLCGGARLGNKMFMLASAIAAAAKSSAMFIIQEEEEECEWVGQFKKIFIEFNSTQSLPDSSVMTWPNVREPGLVTDWLCGGARLGNKMFMLASAIAAAAKSSAMFIIQEEEEDCEWVGQLKKIFIEFNSTQSLPDSAVITWPNVREPGFTKHTPIVVKYRNVTVSGYRQSWKYFGTDFEQKVIRNAFRFSPLYDFIADVFLRKVRARFNFIAKPIFIGVHMRLGDIVFVKRFLNYGYQAANASFYSTSMKAVTSYFNNSKSIIFLVATDSPKLAKDMLKGLEKVYNIYWIGGTANEDFATLTKCNHSIISGGTFGFWAAWLAGGKTFYFSEFGKPGTNFGENFFSENFYPPNWIPVGWS